MGRRNSLILGFGIVCVVFTMSVGTTWAIPLHIDFGVEDAPGHLPGQPFKAGGNDVESGFETFTVPHDSDHGDSGRDGKNPNQAVSKTFGDVTVTIGGGVNGGPSVRDRLDIPNEHDFADVFEDVFNDVLSVTLSGLPAGTFAVTTYNHDSGFGGAEADVFVDGAKAGHIQGTHGLSWHPNPDLLAPSNRPFGTGAFSITSDGSSDVQIEFKEVGTDGMSSSVINLSGISIVPEPAMISLVLLGVLGGWGIFRRVRR